VKFSELVRLLESNGFFLLKEKGSIRYYSKAGWDRLIRIDYHGSKEVPTGTCNAILKAAGIKSLARIYSMIDLPYSLVVEATKDPDFFGFYSPELEGFTGIGHTIEDCLYQARWGMKEHIDLLKGQALPVPPVNPNPTVTIRNEQPAVA
jgi:predicted RNA binding protein YcfA (HicA-like mRNA interferase family)/predicted RNase H-like HicB family nuclease